jgi:hypothetical protein
MMTRRNVSEHPYLDQEDDGDLFEVYQTDEGWFWSFLPHWRDAGPFLTKEAAIFAGENFVDVDGEPYIQY